MTVKGVLSALVMLAVLLAVYTGGCGEGGPQRQGSGAAIGVDAEKAQETLTCSGDPYFPRAGNSGYEVRSYELDLSIDPRRGSLAGEATIKAVAAQSLEVFSLDLVGLEVQSVRVDGRQASFVREEQELLVTCPARLASGALFTVEVRYQGAPVRLEVSEEEGMFPVGWRHQDDVIYTLDEPVGAATWFPVNDHPSDKAVFVFRLTIPRGYTAVATGTLVDVSTAGGSCSFVWRMDYPMASYLAGIVVGELVERSWVTASGIGRRDYFAPPVADIAAEAFAQVGDMLDYFAGAFGPYPFGEYGVVVPDAVTQAAMENQTLALYGRDVLEKRMADPAQAAIYVSHELAHQWFGDSVTPAQWDDIWLSEGFATYASWLWLEHAEGPRALDHMVQESVQMLREQEGVPPAAPGPDQMFSASVYRRGALALHALRLAGGDEVFFRTLRQWATACRYGNADTNDFIAFADQCFREAGGPEVGDLLKSWLFDTKMPALPVQLDREAVP